MCLIIFAYQCQAKLPLVLAANRDEFFARATAPAHFWDDAPQVLAGRDLEQGGTWMGINRQGRFAAITNFRDPDKSHPAPRSRGELTRAFLTQDIDAEAYLLALAEQRHAYGGFNLLIGDAEQLWFLSNSGMAANDAPRRLEPGLYGLSNAALDSPWPKVVLGKERMQQRLQHAPDHDTLAEVVADREPAASAELQSLNLDGEMDQLLSAQFIVAGSYGTRCTTTLWFTDRGEAHFRERSFDDQSRVTGTVEEQLDVSA